MDYYNTVDKKIWGPHYWFVIHNFASQYPDNPTYLQKVTAKRFITLLPFILPCSECAEDTYKYIELHFNNIEYIIANKNSLMNFFYTFHDNVNQKLGRPRIKTLRLN